jgi:hypothetical protein
MTISALYNDPCAISIDESVIEDQGKYCMYEFPFAVGNGSGRCTCIVPGRNLEWHLVACEIVNKY